VLGAWIPLAAGVAMVEALADDLASRARLKWPNDVLVDGRKICGILAEWTPGGIVVGAGLNTRMTQEQLPVATATSLQLAGVEPHVDAVVARYLTGLREHLALSASRLRDRVAARLDTLGREVRAELPDGSVVAGAAVDLDSEGRLVVQPDGGVAVAVAAGDIVHLR
jgi:BirA family biotin operon repressor/biotin-[acetyl-CoA-carboxylase] ligase